VTALAVAAVAPDTLVELIVATLAYEADAPRKLLVTNPVGIPL
jgi:hypothetical protein